MAVVRLPVMHHRHYQIPFWKAMDSGCNRAVMSWHRRGGKDITHFQYMVREAIRRPGSYYYYFPTLELAKKALWNNIVEFYYRGKIVQSGNMVDILCPKDIRSRRNDSDCFVELLNGSIIKIGGTDNLSVIGMNGYGYAFSEWQSQKKEAFGYISPILRENGGWALFNGTMRGKLNHLYQDIERTKNIDRWFSQWLQPEQTKEYYWINEEEEINVNAELIGEVHPDTLRPYDNIQDVVDAGEISMAMARQEYLNRADSDVYGGYYGYELKKASTDGRFGSIDPFCREVYTFWDLGGSGKDADKTCIVFAHVDMESKKVWVVDYYENRGKKRGHYIEILSQKGYEYGGHYIPHDGKRRSDWTGEGFAETALRRYGTEVRYVPKTNSIINDIEIVRRGFANTEFDAGRCEPLIDALGRYHERETTGKPCHQENCRLCMGASHAADAYRTMHMAVYQGLVESYIKPQKKVELYSTDDYFIV